MLLRTPGGGHVLVLGHGPAGKPAGAVGVAGTLLAVVVGHFSFLGARAPVAGSDPHAAKGTFRVVARKMCGALELWGKIVVPALESAVAVVVAGAGLALVIGPFSLLGA